MNDAEALAQARARWGAAAVVHVERVTFADGTGVVVHSVGRQHDPHSWAALGQGADWESAFAQADQVSAP